MPPENEELDQTESAANDRAIEGMREKLKDEPKNESKTSAEKDDDGDVELELDDDDSEEQAESRAERRRNRYRQLQEEKRDLEERVARAERAALAATEMMRQRQEPREEPARRDLEAEYNSAWDEQQQLADFATEVQNQYAQKGQQLPEHIRNELIQRARGLEKKRIAIANELHTANQPQTRQVDPYVAVIKAEYADVYADNVALSHAQYVYRASLKKGAPDTPETFKAALAEARRVELQGGAPSRPAPSAAAKAKYTGSSAGGSAGASRSAAESGAKKVVTMTPEMRKMADHAFPHIADDRERYKHWAKTAGVNAMDAIAKSKRA